MLRSAHHTTTTTNTTTVNDDDDDNMEIKGAISSRSDTFYTVR
jgi:hypothetical protein